MALTPYRQQIGIPREAGGGVQDIADTRVQDVSGQLDNLSKSLMATAAPRLEEQAILAAQEAAGSMVLERNEEGQLVAPERTPEGGMVYRQAFDKVIQARYLNDVGSDFQSYLDAEMAERRTGNKPYDAADYAQTVESYKQGVLEGMPAWLRAESEELFTREANERTRAFTNEVSRTMQQNFVNGVNQLIGQNLKLIGDPDSLNLMARNRGITPAQLTEQLIAKNAELADRMIETGQMGGEEFDALVMSQDNVVENSQNYYAGAKIMGGMVDIVGQASPELLNWMELAARGAEVEESAGVAVPGGLTRRTGVSEKVTPDVLMGATKLLFGMDPTSGPRSPDHHLSKKNPRSYHNTLNGGRAIDVAPIKGMTFEQYVSRWKAAGFDVVEAINETGSGKTAHATGDHWHVAFGNQREVVEDKPAEGNVPFTRDDFNMLDPRHKQTLLGIINDRRQVIRDAEQERQTQAREDARAAREAANTQRIIDNAVGLENAGAGGDWDGETRGVKDRMFRATFDPANFGNEQTRGQIIQWVQRENFVPPSLIQYVTNGIRSEDWTGALGLYQSLSEASTSRGANIGDLFVEQFDGRTASLLMEADRLERSGQAQQIGPRLERLRSGDGFNTPEAKGAYGSEYDKDRNELLRETFGYGEDVVLDPRLVKDFDAAFASNLDIANRDGSKAMAYAARQMRGRVAKSDIFTGGVGPSVLTRNYSNQKILDFFTNETRADTGGPLVPKVKGGHRMGREGSTIQLAPLDSQTRTVGRYMVIVRNPENLTQVIDSFEIDLGKELREYYTKQGKGAQVNQVDAARARRTLLEKNTRTDMGSSVYPYPIL